MQIPAKYSSNLHGHFQTVTKVLIVEKDTVFQRVITVINDPTTLIVTAKGYPDFATRKFLVLLQ